MTTATATTAAAPTTVEPATRSARASRVPPLLLVAELALVAVSVAVTVGFNRLFVDGSFFPRLAWFVLASHAVAAVARRTGFGIVSSAGLSALGLILVTGWVLYPDTTSWGIPSGATLDAAGDHLGNVWALFQEVKAPAPVDPGFLLVAALALWVSAFVADWAAFRLWVPFEAIVPAGTLFVFCAMLGAPRHRTTATFLFLAAVLGFVLAHRVARQQASGGWLENDVQRGSNAMLRSGARLATLAVLVGVAGGPLLPGAGSGALVNWREFDPGGDSRTTVSPLVQLQQQLIERSETEMFSVTSSHRSYWRLTALDTFDGNIWTSSGSYGGADGELPNTGAFAGPGETVTQEFRILNLDAIWLPAAFEPAAIDPGRVEVRWESESGSLIVGRDRETSDDLVYAVQSVTPRPDAEFLQSAAAEVAPPGGIVERYTRLEDGTVSDRVRAQAREVVAGAGSAYGQALALQNWFRDNFEYSLDPDLDASSGVMERFLFEIRAGYCQQFAGAFVAMARAVGLPARVAIGFTPGDADPVHPGVYHVRGKHGHAWPEVYIGSVGWVLFEPTPNRGAPFAEQYTGVPEQQVDSTNPGTGTTLAPAPSPEVTLPEDGASTTSIFDPVPEDVGGAGQREPQPNPFATFWRRWGDAILRVLGGALAVVALYVLLVPSAHALRRRRRRARAVAPEQRVGLAWTESVEAMAVLGVQPRASETLAEFARRAGRQIDDGERYGRLARTAEQAVYSPTGVDEPEAEAAVETSEEIQADVRQLATTEQRVRAALDPRRLLPRPASRSQFSGGAPLAEGRRDRVRAGV